MRIALCDDNKDWLGIEREYIARIGVSDIVCDSFDSGEALLDAIGKNGCVYDAILLDMEMGGMNGIKTANLIRERDRHILIVFVTSFKKYMQESFECLPFRFLLKPIEYGEFERVMLKLINAVSENKRTLVFNEDRSVISLLQEDILFIQSVDHRICIKTADRVYQTYTYKLAEVAGSLDSGSFVKVHRSYIINIRHIRAISKNTVTLRGYNHDIPVSNKYINELKRRVLLFEERRHL